MTSEQARKIALAYKALADLMRDARYEAGAALADRDSARWMDTSIALLQKPPPDATDA